MAGSDDSCVHGGFNEEVPPIARAELRQLGNSLLEAMERMFNERIPAGGERPAQHEEFDENLGFGNGFHDRFGDGRGGHGGGRRAGRGDQHGGRAHGRGRGHRVHFDDEEEVHDNYDEEFDEDENPFAEHRRYGQHQDHHHGAGHDGEHHRHHNRDDLDNVARVKLSVPKFSGREDAYAYLEWEE
jgi:hypothetical protein